MGKYNWTEIEQDLPNMTDRQITDKYGISSYRIVSNYRNSKKLPTWHKRQQILDAINTSKSDKEAAEILGCRVNTVTVYRIRHGIGARSGRKENEDKFASYVANKLGGVREYCIDYHKVDVLTDDKIIECKYELHIANCYMAIGQLMVYKSLLADTRSLAIACYKMDAISSIMLKAISALGIEIMVFPEYSELNI